MHQFGLFCTKFCKATKRSQCIQIVQNTKKMSLESNGVDRVHSLRKITTRLRGTNFCTSSARFAPSFVSQPKRSQMHPNFMKCTKTFVRVEWGGSGAFVSKNFDATSYHELLYQFVEFFATNAPDPPHWTLNKCFVARTFAPFRPVFIEFGKSTKWSQMHQNFMKCTKTFF